MSPGVFVNGDYGAFGFYVYGSGYSNRGGLLDNDYVSNGYGVRPSISLKPGVKIRDGGDGTSTSPYEFVVE